MCCKGEILLKRDAGKFVVYLLETEASRASASEPPAVAVGHFITVGEVMSGMITGQRRDMLRWTAESVQYVGGLEGRMYPHPCGGWYPWMPGSPKPRGLTPPRRRPQWRDIDALVQSGHLYRAESGGPRRRPIDDRVHTMTSAGWSAVGMVRSDEE